KDLIEKRVDPMCSAIVTQIQNDANGQALFRLGDRMAVIVSKNQSSVNKVSFIELFNNKGMIATEASGPWYFDSDGSAYITFVLTVPEGNTSAKYGRGGDDYKYKLRAWTSTPDGPHCTSFSLMVSWANALPVAEESTSTYDPKCSAIKILYPNATLGKLSLVKNSQVTVRVTKGDSKATYLISIDLYTSKGAAAFLWQAPADQKLLFGDDGTAEKEVTLTVPDNPDFKLGNDADSTEFFFRIWTGTEEGPHCTTMSDAFNIINS
ncbi:3277_t:CDS:2, partial [Ambispora gerdemannii]